MSLTSPLLSLLCLTFQVSRPGGGGNHGEAVAVRDAGCCHGSARTDLPEALRMSDPVSQPGDPLCEERSAVCAAEHWQAYSGATAGWQLCHEVTSMLPLPRELVLHTTNVASVVTTLLVHLPNLWETTASFTSMRPLLSHSGGDYYSCLEQRVDWILHFILYWCCKSTKLASVSCLLKCVLTSEWLILNKIKKNEQRINLPDNQSIYGTLLILETEWTTFPQSWKRRHWSMMSSDDKAWSFSGEDE